MNTTTTIGSPATYHGSIDHLNGHTFLVLPHNYYGTDTNCPCAQDGAPTRYTLIDPTTPDVLHHVRPSSFTVSDEQWWPTGAVDFDIAGHLYKASHTTPGGSPRARIVHFHLADGALGRTWCHFTEVTDTIRLLDRRALTALSAA